MGDYDWDRDRDPYREPRDGGQHISQGTSRRSIRLASSRSSAESSDYSARRASRTDDYRVPSTGPGDASRRASSRSRNSRGSRNSTYLRRGSRTSGRPNVFVSLIGAIADTIASAIGGSRGYDRSIRHHHGSSNQLHSTFRSGSAASSSSSFRTLGSTGGLQRGGYGGGRQSSVIGRPLRRGYASFSHGGSRRGRRGGWQARPVRTLSAASIAIPAVALSLVLFLITSVAITTPAGIEPDTEATKLNVGVLSPSDFPMSTPVDEWRQGEMPHLYQTDVRWCNLPYGGDTVAKNACGPTVMAMLYVYFTGNTDMDPGSMASWAELNNYVPTGATEWSFMTDAAYAFGFYAEMINPTRGTVEGALRNGNPVACSVRPGDFTNVGHYIILAGIDENNMVTVYDPNSPEHSARKWDLVRVLNQTAIAWVYSAA